MKRPSVAVMDNQRFTRSLRKISIRSTRARRRGSARRAGSRGARVALRQRLRTRSTENYAASAKFQLKRFRQGSQLAVALTALLLMIWSVPGTGAQQESTAANTKPGESVGEATGTLRDLFLSFYGYLPKILIAIGILVVAAMLAKAVRLLLRRTLANWKKADAVSAVTVVIIALLALGASLSVIAGDARALVGSVGLAGLALSWALQTPIESFTGWLLNSFRGYYREGDRIEVGDVFGDVYKIDILTTTVWEAGGPDKPVAGAQPTGALITFPNSEILRSNVTNYTRDFPYVWDEVTQGIANESDVPYAIRVVHGVAADVLGEAMRDPIIRYRGLLEHRSLNYDVSEEPRVFVSLTDAWTNLTIRYLVPARERRKWSSELIVRLSTELAKDEHRGKIFPSYPRTQIEVRGSIHPEQPSSFRTPCEVRGEVPQSKEIA